MWFIFIPAFIYFWTKVNPFERSISGGRTDEYDELFKKYGSKEGVSPKMLKAIAMNESLLGKYVGHEPIGGTSGLMHIKLSTAQDFMPELTAWSFSDFNPWQDENQIEAAAKYIKHLKNQFPFSKKKVVMSYNQGEGNTKNGKEYAQEYWERYLRNEGRLG